MTLKLTNLFGGGSLPIGAPVSQQDFGPVDTWGDGSVWLRSGTYSPISQYPLAAQLKKFQVYAGIQGGTTPVPIGASSYPTAVANPCATDGNQTIAYVSAATGGVNLLVTTNGATSWSLVNVGLPANTVLGDVVFWPAHGIWVVLACNASTNTAYAYTAAAPTGPWTQAGSFTYPGAGSAPPVAGFPGGGGVQGLVVCGSTLVAYGAGGPSSTNYSAQLYVCTAANAGSWATTTFASSQTNNTYFAQRPVWTGSALLIVWMASTAMTLSQTSNFTSVTQVTTLPGAVFSVLGVALGNIWASSSTGTYKTPVSGGLSTWTTAPSGNSSPATFAFDGTRIVWVGVVNGQGTGGFNISTDGVNFTNYPTPWTNVAGIFVLSSGLVIIPAGNYPAAGPSMAYLAPQWPNPDSVGTTNEVFTSTNNYGTAYTLPVYYRVA